MARISFLLGLTACLLNLLTPTFAVEIWDIFTVDRTKDTDGACKARMTVLDQWLSEGSYSLDVALNAIDNYLTEPAVRDAMTTFFGVQQTEEGRKPSTIEPIRKKIQWVHYFFNQERNPKKKNELWFKANEYYLFCDSDFLARRDKTDSALDFQTKVIVDKDNNEISIDKVPGYATALRKEAKAVPWWAGASGLNGYFFTESGGDYCDTAGNFGLTAKIELFKQGANGKAQKDRIARSVIICPNAFDQNQPDSYKEANELLATGTNLADAVPKSATLVHELFHAIHGGDFSTGKAEEYDLGACIKLAEQQVQNSRKNIENYIFFIAHMYHLYGEADGEEPWSIKKNWNFQIEYISNSKDFIYGATEDGDAMDVDE
ncbi:hypothetical protein QBC36DRAFT_61655 [Triangularia setosa]|uniref:Uncharacterized protein n=1 Tax=Triangularia setosa TaxID=2587417 RepID=A0AAN6W1D4_9PEZI|nr:hypothetical protein QBC36DRAFT_61655 [Podospora setosa]